MALETVNRVKDAEQMAQQAEREAREKAQQILDGANKDAEQAVLKMEQEALARAQQRIRQAKEQADAMLRDAQEQSRKDTAALEEAATKKQSAAIEKIIGRIV